MTKQPSESNKQPSRLACSLVCYRTILADRIRGQHIEVQDILRIYEGWTVHLNPNIDVTREDLETLLRIFIPTEDQRAKTRKTDSPLCAGAFWAKAPKDKMLILGRWMAWIFFWDDEIDCGLMSHDSEQVSAYIDDSIAFVRHYLQPERGTPPPVSGRLHNCGPWVDIAEAMVVGQSIEERNRYTESVIGYFEHTRSAQAQRQLECRHRTSTLIVEPKILGLIRV
jgi:hypothetical protein